MRASRLVTAAVAAALVTGWVPAAGQAFPTQGSRVISAADAPRDASTGQSSGRRQY